MDITPVDRIVASAPTAVVPLEKDAEKRDVIKAVTAVNHTEMFGSDNQLLFVKDPETRRMVVKLVNKKTNEVVSQVPPEYILRLAEDLKNAQQGE